MMKRFQKQLRHVLVTVVLLGVTAWGLDASGLLVRGLRPLMQRGLESALGCAVRLESVEGGLFGSLTLRGVEIDSQGGEPAWTLRVPRARLTYSWLAWLRHGDPLASLRGIDLDRPALELRLGAQAPTAGQLGNTPFALPALPLLGPALSIEHGRVSVKRGDVSQEWVKDLGLAARLYNGRLSIAGKAVGAPGGELSFQADSSADGQSVQAQLRPRGLPLQAWGAMLGVSGLPQVSLSHGELNLRRAPVDTGQWSPGWRLEGFVDLDANQLTQDALAPRQVRAHLRLRDRHADIEKGSFELAGAWDVRGRLGDLSAPDLALSISAKSLDLGALALASGADLLSVTAKAQIQGELRGLWPSPVWRLSAKAPDARVGRYGVGDLRAEGFGQGAFGSLSFSAGSKGAERLALTLVRAGSDALATWSARARAKDFPLESLAWPQGLSVSGQGDLNLEWDAGKEAPRWRVRAQAPRLMVSQLELKACVVDARLQKGALEFDAHGDWRGRRGMHIKAKGVWSKEGIRLTRADLGQGMQTWALARGHWALGGQDSDFDLELKALPLPWVGEILAKSLSGTAKGRAHWQQQGARRHATLKATSTDLRYLNASLPAAIEFELNDQSWDLSRLDLRHGELVGSAQGLGAAWPLTWTATLDHADLAVFSTLLGRDDVAGSASGTVAGQGETRWQSKVDVEVPRFGSLSADSASLQINREGKHWRVERMLALQSEGGKVEGDAKLLPGQAPQLALTIKDWRLGGRVWSAQARTQQESGVLARWTGASAGARMRLDAWSVNGQVLPAAEALLVFDGQVFEARDLVWGALRGHARWQADASDALVEVRDDDLADVFQFFGGSQTGLGQGVSGSLHWQAKHGLGESDLRLKASDPKRPLEIEAQAVVTSGSAWGVSLTGSATWGVAKSVTSVQIMGKANAQGADLTRLRWQRGSAWAEASALRLETGSKGIWKAKGNLRADGFVAVDTFTLGGEAAFDAKGDTRVGVLDLDLSQLHANRQIWTKNRLRLTWNAGLWRLDDRSPDPALASALQINADGWDLKELRVRTGPTSFAELSGYSKNGMLDLEGQANAFPTQTLTRMLNWGSDWTGRVSGNIGIRGANADLRTTLSLKIEDGSAAGFPFDLATAQVLVQGEHVRLDPLGQPGRMSRKGRYQAEVRGQFPLKRADGTWPPMELKIDFSQADLALLDYMDWVESAKGPMRVKARVTGTPDDPELDASLEMEEGTLKLAWLLAPLDKVRARLRVDKNQLAVQTLEGWQAEGRGVVIEHADAKRPGMVLDRFVPRQMNLRLRGSKAGVLLTHNPHLRFAKGLARPDIGVTGDWDEPRLNGTFALEQGSVQWPPVWGRGSAQALSPDAEALTERLRWDLLLKPAPGTQVETDNARVHIDAGEKGIRLLGRGAERGLVGRVKVQKGSLQFLTANFLVPSEKVSIIDFQAEAPPFVDIWGQRTLRNAQVAGESAGRDRIVYIHAKGELGRVNVDFSSNDSGLSQAQMASLAGLGVDVTGNQAQVGVGNLLGKVTAGLLSKGLRRTGWVDDVGMKLGVVEDALARGTPEPGSNAQGETGSAKSRSLVEVSAGKYVGERWWVGLGGILQEDKAKKGTELNTSVGVEYDLGKQSKLSYERRADTVGETEQRVLIQKHSDFENYDPRKRRQKYLDRLTPTPAASPVPTPWKDGP